MANDSPVKCKKCGNTDDFEICYAHLDSRVVWSETGKCFIEKSQDGHDINEVRCSKCSTPLDDNDANAVIELL